jgi:hypothetical protein
VAKSRDLSQIVELGDRVLNVRQLVSVYQADGEKGFAIVLDYGNGTADFLAYTNERERNRNFTRVEGWLHEYPSFITVRNQIINLLKFQFSQCIDKKLILQMQGKKIEVEFESSVEADKTFKEFGEITHAKVK